ncbi:class I SAM-dependent methyltransferase [Pararhodospirillum oryzae]|uniref:Methyltransferase type 11 domain-containing protein n=1 Tax=Pararhodospirillum oryzae TaxID=478448 RepID=A0A512H989_9PROT|nr:class I SAM-dependent methyltransferase [Pararhodospirillum oryzae]GEO82026.1 hypothetical protein ROR02_21570 [Pararhodospirillum oryzae]
MGSGFKDHFSACADGYARFRPQYPPDLAPFLASRCPAPGLAIDCGCGSGQLSGCLAAAFASVWAVDASAAQIQAAPAHERVRYHHAPAEDTGLPPGEADLIAVAQAAHWFDLPRFHDEARRLARPGALLALISYGVTETDGAPGAALAHLYHTVLGPYWPPERHHVETGYRLLPFPFPEEEAPPLAMTASWSLDELVGYIGTWSALKGARAAGEDARLARAVDDLAAAWGPPESVRVIRWPLALRLGRL